MKPRVLRLLPLDLAGEDLALLDWLGSALARRLPVLPVLEWPVAMDPRWREPGDGRFSSNRVVDQLVQDGEAATDAAPDQWTLAVTAEDLSAPGRTFVFGEATLGGAYAVVSLARLRMLDSPDPQARLRDRALKEALHEIGHLAGLGHCSRVGCVMAASADAEEVDRKTDSFCPECGAAFAGAP